MFLSIRTYLGNASKNQVRFVLRKTTLNPDIRGECRITAPTSCFVAKSTVGTVPILCPYKIIVSGLILNLYLIEIHVNKII